MGQIEAENGVSFSARPGTESGFWIELGGSGLPRPGWAQVAEWLMAADCKSAGLRPTEVRTLPCAPEF